ncbi:hypothetical protein BJ508DRAFT_336309 [Ascobolus immersus RN42]|uniref:Uncharacterized protein n=1 Tax=Ascobolus immersus RN42 TaxID=1160509 RepID=A0A3N4H8Y6_ASCIM|nr:hypothetical protein BJ508DRAFT_336309 [Ascobolus immersus RN42]
MPDLPDWPNASLGSGAVFSDMADATFIELGYFDPFEPTNDVDPMLYDLGTTDATSSAENWDSDADEGHLAVPLPSSPPPAPLSASEQPPSSPPSVEDSHDDSALALTPPSDEIHDEDPDINLALVSARYPSRTARRECLDQWAALRIHGRLPNQLRELRQRGLLELQAVMTLCNVSVTLDEAESNSWTETDEACLYYWLRYRNLSTQEEHDEVIEALAAFSQGSRSLAFTSIGAWARLYLEQYFCSDQAILTALPDSDSDSNLAEDEWEPDSSNAVTDSESDSESCSDFINRVDRHFHTTTDPDLPDDYTGTTPHPDHHGPQQEFEHVVWQSLRAEVESAGNESVDDESEPEPLSSHHDSDGVTSRLVMSHEHRQHTGQPASIFQVYELRLLIAEKLEWRDFLAFRQIDTVNMELLSVQSQFRRYEPDRIPETLLKETAKALFTPNHFFDVLFECVHVKRNFPSSLCRTESVGYYPIAREAENGENSDYRLGLDTVFRDGQWRDWRAKIHLYNIHSSLILVTELLGDSSRWETLSLEPPLTAGQIFNLEHQAGLSMLPTIDDLYNSLKFMRAELSQVREAMARDVRGYSIQERVSFKVLRDLHRMLNDILWICVRRARASHPRYLPVDIDRRDTPLRKFIVEYLKEKTGTSTATPPTPVRRVRSVKVEEVNTAGFKRRSEAKFVKRKHLLSEDGTASEASFYTARSQGQSTTASRPTATKASTRSAAGRSTSIPTSTFESKGKSASAAGPSASTSTSTTSLDSFALAKYGLERPKPSYTELEERNRDLQDRLCVLETQWDEASRQIYSLKHKAKAIVGGHRTQTNVIEDGEVVLDVGQPFVGREVRQQSPAPEVVEGFPLDRFEHLMDDGNVDVAGAEAGPAEVDVLAEMVGDIVLGGEDAAVPAGPRRAVLIPVAADEAVPLLLARLRASERERDRLEQENLVLSYWPRARDRLVEELQSQSARISAMSSRIGALVQHIKQLRIADEGRVWLASNNFPVGSKGKRSRRSPERYQGAF